MNDRAYRNGRELDDETEGTMPLGPTIPTCPWCGQDDNASYVGRQQGRYFCGCGSLFMGTDSEWRRLAQHRREAAERAAGDYKPLPVQRHEKPTRVAPLRDRVEGDGD